MKKTITLNNKNKMPVVGLGTWQSKPGVVGNIVKEAIELGYRHIDCAHIYGNEAEIGEAFSDIFTQGSVNREEVFITSKLWNTDHHPEAVEQACRTTLNNLQLEYLDLYLIHWGIPFQPNGDPRPIGEDGFAVTEPVPLHATWRALENLVKKGLVKSIGVANYTAPMMLDLLNYAAIPPAVNQIEIHPYNAQPDLVAYCQAKGVAITAYSPLGSAVDTDDKPLSNPKVIQIAEQHNKSCAQVLLRWSLQRGLIVIPKTTHSDRLRENFDIFDFELTEDEMQTLTDLNRNHRYVNPSKMWGFPYFQ